ncbi:MAG: T9SS type A sorting domain-containing protein [Bacteroidales bacterium]|nr:T9SS type A sorting domain-containing protein [Bacteroidales bacterium]
MKKFFTIGLSLILLLSLTSHLSAQTWGNNDSRLVPVSQNISNGMVSSFPPTTTIVVDNYLYFTDFFGFQVYNVSNPATPLKIATLPIPGRAMHFTIQGDYAYVCNESGVAFVNISNPAQPTLEMVRFLDYVPCRIIVEQDRLYLASVEAVYAYTLGASHSLTFAGSIEIPPATVTFAGFIKKDNYIYYVNQRYLYVIDVSNPQMMVSVYSTEFGGSGSCWGNLQIQGDYLYVATTLALQVYNISNPTNPTIVYSGLPTTHTIYEVLVEGDRMVLNHSTNAYFTILDISNPANPVALFKHDGSWYFGSSKLGFLKNNILYGMDTGQEGYRGYTLHLIDISNPLDPIHKGSLKSFPGYTRSVALMKKNNQSYALVGQSNGNPQVGSGLLRILNVTHPDDPYQESVLEMGSDIVSVTALNQNYAAVVSGTYVLPVYHLQLSLINIEDPSTPYITDNSAIGQHMGLFNNSSITSTNGIGFALSQYNLFIFKETQGGLTTLSSPAVYGGHAMGIFTNNPNYVYIAGGNFGVQLYNVSNPENPFMINYHQTVGTCWDVYVDNGVACVAAYNGGLAVYDVSQNMIIPLTQVNTVGKALSVVMLNHTAYVGMEDGRIQVFDLTNPAQPVSKGWYLTDGTTVNDMVIDLDPGKSLLYVANELTMPIYQMDYFVGNTELNATSAEARIYPNPAKDKAFIQINLPGQSQVELRLYNLSGQCVGALNAGMMPAGRSQIEYELTGLPQGIYMVELIAGNIRMTEKMMVNN